MSDEVIEKKDERIGAYARTTVVIALIAKIAGIVVGFHEAMFSPPADPLVLCMSAIWVSGVQLTENGMLRVIDHVLGRSR